MSRSSTEARLSGRFRRRHRPRPIDQIGRLDRLGGPDRPSLTHRPNLTDRPSCTRRLRIIDMVGLVDRLGHDRPRPGAVPAVGIPRAVGRSLTGPSPSADPRPAPAARCLFRLDGRRLHRVESALLT